MRVVALVDGEHYPDVTRWALAEAAAAGFRVEAALLIGGVEKLPAGGRLDVGDVPVRRADGDPMGALAAALDEVRPEGVLDLSDAPVLAYERRMEAAAVALARGVPYLGPDFRFDPPWTEPAIPPATVGVIGTGKRVAKTGVSGHLARLAAAEGLAPVVVAMGRGGPPSPVVAGPEDVTVDALLARADRGEHAASDYLEDALTAGVPTVGARRAGGGMGGRPFATNAGEAARVAAARGAGLVILEGSGASLPPVPWDAGVLVVPSSVPLAHVAGYGGPLRVLLSDLAILIMSPGPRAGTENLSALDSHIRRLRPGIRIAHAVLDPVPLADVRDKDVFVATTAAGVSDWLVERLERTAGCRVVGISARLADRAGLEEDLASAPRFDVLATELKAAAVDVAARRALERGAGVVFLDNRPRAVGGDGEVDDLLREVAGLARERAAGRPERPAR